MNLCTIRCVPIRTIARLRGTTILIIVQMNTSSPQAQYELLINSQVLSTKKFEPSTALYTYTRVCVCECVCICVCVRVCIL